MYTTGREPGGRQKAEGRSLGVLKFFDGIRGVKISEGKKAGWFFFPDAIERLSICNIIENHCTSEVPYFLVQ